VNIVVIFRLSWRASYFLTELTVSCCTGLFEMIVGVVATATTFSRCNPMWFLSMGLRQGLGLCSSSSRKYPGTEGTNQNRHWNHHHWHATNSLERTRLSCWCLWNHKRCTYKAPVRYVTKTWSVVLLNKKYIYSYLKCVFYDKLLKPWHSFRITLHIGILRPQNEVA